MSNKDNNNAALVGAVAVGVGALFGLGYAAYQSFQENEKQKKVQQSFTRTTPSRDNVYSTRAIESSRASPRDNVYSAQAIGNGSSSRRVEKIGNKCELCSREINEEMFGLDCNHIFHKHCLLAKYVLADEPFVFKCPAKNCNIRIPEGKIAALTK